MKEREENILFRLHKWAIRQDENFTSEAFAHLLWYLLRHEPNSGCRLLANITKDRVILAPNSANNVSVVMQGNVEGHHPDIIIETNADEVVCIEAKVESPVQEKQLANYHNDLKTYKPGFHTTLVLLTRYPFVIDTLKSKPNVQIYWYQIADWLQAESDAIVDCKAAFYLAEFVGFLKVRNMTKEKVEAQLWPGLQAMCHLIKMLEEAALMSGFENRERQANHVSIGFYLENRKYWVGIEYGESASPPIAFYTQCPIVSDAEAIAGVGHIWPNAYWANNGPSWSHSLELKSGEGEFFNCSNTEQQNILTNFLKRIRAITSQIVSGEKKSLPQ
jgi:hypothetical protein